MDKYGMQKKHPGKTRTQLTPQQELLITLLADPFDRRTVAEKAAHANVTPNYVYQLRRKPLFQAKMREELMAYVNERRARVRLRLEHWLQSEDPAVSLQAATLMAKIDGDLVAAGANVNIGIVNQVAQEDFRGRLKVWTDKRNNNGNDPDDEDEAGDN